MFRVLNNQKATCLELADAYKQAAEAEQGLKIKKDETYLMLLDVQKDCLSDSKFSKPVKDANQVYETAKIRQEACKHGLKQLKAKLVERLPIEAGLRIEQIKSEQKNLLVRKQDVHKKYLEAIAEVQLLQNSIKGAPLMCTTAGNWVAGPLRDVKFAVMDPEDRIFIREIIEKNSGKEPGLDLKISSLGDEQESVSKLLAEPDVAALNPQAIVEKLEREVERLIEKA
jgi:hypothetical protein